MNVKCVVLALLALAACGGQKPADARPADVFQAFAQAAAKQDGDRLWSLISERMKAQISREEFTAPSVLRTLRDDYAQVAAGSVVLDLELEDDLSLVALEGKGPGPGVRAAILRLEEGEWRVQLTELDLVYGSGDLDFQVNARREDRRRSTCALGLTGRKPMSSAPRTLFSRPSGFAQVTRSITACTASSPMSKQVSGRARSPGRSSASG